MALEVPKNDAKGMNDSQSALPVAEGTSESDEISLLDLLIFIAERMRMIVWTSVSFTIVAVVISLLLPKKYTATVTLLPPQQSSSMGAALSAQMSSLTSVASLAGGSLGLKNPNDMLVGMLKSRTVEDAMVQRFSLMEEYRDKYPSDARKDFEKRVTVDGSGKDGLIHISIEDHDPKRSAELANGYVDEFRRLSEHLAISEASQRRVFFERQLEQAKNNLANAEEAMKRTEQSTGLIQLDSQARALIESASALRAEIAAKEVQIQGIQTYATSENAQLVQAQRELDSMRNQLARLGGVDDTVSAGLMVPKGKVPAAGLEYVRKLRDVKYYETIFEILARQFESAKLDEAKQGALIQIVDQAVIPDKRSSPRRSVIVIAAGFLGLLFGVLLAVMQATLGRIENDPYAKEKFARLRLAISKVRPNFF